MITIRLSKGANDDLEQAYWFYERQEPGLGDYFRSCLDADIEGLLVTAGIHRQTFNDYHRLISRIFPYAIYYTLSDGTAVVWAVIDCRRNPEWIREHLE